MGQAMCCKLVVIVLVVGVVIVEHIPFLIWKSILHIYRIAGEFGCLGDQLIKIQY